MREKVLLLTAIFSIPCAVICYFFAPLIINILFGSLSIQDKFVAVSLLKICSPTIILLCLLQTLNAVLIAQGKFYFPTISLGVGVLVKFLVSIILLPNPKFNIYGGALGLIACYFFACLINLIMIISLRVKNECSTHCYRQFTN